MDPASSTLSSRLLGVVLAGGLSTRMGRSKAGLSHPEGGTFLDHTINQLAAICPRVACSLAADSDTTGLPDRVQVVFDEKPSRGPAEGVARSLALGHTLRCTGVLVTPVDLPRLKSAHLQRLSDAFYKTPDRIVCALSDNVTSKKRLQPLVAIYPLGLQADLARLADSDSRSLYRFIASRKSVTVELPCEVLHNVNSPDDLFS